MKICNIFNIFQKNKQKNIDVKFLPSQGYFYPKNLKITIYSGTDADRDYFLKNLVNSNIFGIIETVKFILKKRINFSPCSYSFEQIRAIDIFYIFIEFVKLTTKKDVKFNGVNFSSKNFMYFNFDEYINEYNEETREFIFDGWKFSLPSIGIETSLNRFSYEITIKGELDKYQNSNYNLIYFLGDKSDLDYDGMVNIINIMQDLSKKDERFLDDIVDKFSNVGVYLLIVEGKEPVKISPSMIKGIWG